MKFHIVVILLLIAKVVSERLERSGPGGYTCNNLELGNCTNNAKIQISKDSQEYRIRLCPSEQQCTPVAAADMSLDWIRCRDICDACESLLGPNSCTNTNEQCEDEVDAFLDSYCANFTAISTLATTSAVDNVITPTQCTQTTVTTTVTPSCTTSGGGTFQVTIPISSVNSGDQSPLTAERNNALILALGALLGLSVLLLALVTTGWVCTCLIMKKREVANSSAYKGEDTGLDMNYKDYDEVERIFKNPTYEGTSTMNPTTAAVMYDTVGLPTKQTMIVTKTGHMYETLDKQDENGHTSAEAGVSQDAAAGGSQRTGENNNSQSDGERNYYEIKKDFLDNDN